MLAERQEKEIHLLDYWHVILKRRWVIFTSLAVVVSVTTLGSFLQRPVYTATTRLQIEQNTHEILNEAREKSWNGEQEAREELLLHIAEKKAQVARILADSTALVSP